MKIIRFVEDGVETFETQIDGEKIQWDKGLTYAKHLQTDQLLSSQVPVSDQPDEMLFIVMHQTMELWIKLLLHELRLVAAALQSDEIDPAIKTLDRTATIQRHMIHSWEVLATLTPHDFLTFRGYLRKASGFQSHQYRELEFMLGNKRRDLMLVHSDNAEATKRLVSVLQAPSIYDHVLALLARRGFAIPASHLERDWSEPYQPCPEVEDAWLKVYSNVEDFWNLYTLGERITGLEYYFQEWRFKHMKTVARVIGQKPGTGGSSGVNYLVKALDLSFFPELWAMRTRMTAPKIGPSYADQPVGQQG
jgi:tryptophan 2,3-dioxygenase